jgi:hypothetical protein
MEYECFKACFAVTCMPTYVLRPAVSIKPSLLLLLLLLLVRVSQQATATSLTRSLCS